MHLAEGQFLLEEHMLNTEKPLADQVELKDQQFPKQKGRI
jgi:hypothetical protein